jgi:ATP-dependent RNA helicase DeaD
MKEVGKIRIIERLIKKKFTQANVPTGFQACETQLFSLVKKIHEVEVNEKAIEAYLPKIYDELKALTREDIIKRFVSTEFNRFLDYYKNAPDLNASTGRDRPSVSVNGITKLFINLGELDNLDSNTMKEYISEVSGVPMNLIVNIDVKSSFSFVEVKTEAAEIITGTFKNIQYNNRNVRIESRGDSGVEKRSYGGGAGNSSYGERKSYGNYSDRGGDRGGYGSRSNGRSGSGERKSYGSGGSGERKNYGDRPERSGYAKRTGDSGNTSGERKSYSDRSDKGAFVKKTTSESGERKSNFSREKRPRKTF